MPPIQDDAHRLVLEELVSSVPHGQRGIVRQHGATAHQDRVDDCPKRVSVGARHLRGDPAGGPVGGGDPAVDGRGDLPSHERAPGLQRVQPGAERASGNLVVIEPGHDVDAGRDQLVGTTRGHRVDVVDRVDDPHDAGIHERVRARSRPAGMGAGLQGNDGRSAARADPGPGECHHLRVGAARGLCRALTGERSGRVEDHRPHGRIGTGTTAHRFRER
jgi:hypothetical protein